MSDIFEIYVEIVEIFELKSDFCGVECRSCDACYQLTSVFVWYCGARLRTTDVQTQATKGPYEEGGKQVINRSCPIPKDPMRKGV